MRDCTERRPSCKLFLFSVTEISFLLPPTPAQDAVIQTLSNDDTAVTTVARLSDSGQLLAVAASPLGGRISISAQARRDKTRRNVTTRRQQLKQEKKHERNGSSPLRFLSFGGADRRFRARPTVLIKNLVKERAEKNHEAEVR